MAPPTVAGAGSAMMMLCAAMLTPPARAFGMGGAAVRHAFLPGPRASLTTAQQPALQPLPSHCSSSLNMLLHAGAAMPRLHGVHGVHGAGPRRPLSRSAGARASSSSPPSETGGDDPFVWRNEWYPLAPVQDLAHDKPNKLTLLGMDLVIWLHAPSDRWRVFADVCPHRLVPLSEGRVEPNGVLQCAYHGWEFGEEGKCVRIPQMGRALCEDSPSVRSERACATSFPAQVRQGLLWVFPTADEALAGTTFQKYSRSVKTPALIPELDDPEFVDATNFFVRDMPYSWDVLVENLYKF